MSTNIFTPFTEEELMPKEEKLEVIKRENSSVLEFLRKPVSTKGGPALPGRRTGIGRARP